MSVPATDLLTRPNADLIAERHPHVVARIRDETGLSEDAAGGLFQDAVRFLDLVHESDTPLAPSRAIDDAWHAFILFTRDYRAFCRDRYGAFVHHDPSTEEGAGGESGRDAYLRTRALAEARYGTLDPLGWPEASAVADCGGEGECKAEGNCKADCDGSCGGTE